MNGHDEGGFRDQPVWSDGRSERGHSTEDWLLQISPSIGFKVVERQEVGHNLIDRFAIARATINEDWDRGIDFWIWDRQRGRWFSADLTTSGRPDNRPDLALLIRHKTLEKAAMGGTQYRESIRNGILRELGYNV